MSTETETERKEKGRRIGLTIAHIQKTKKMSKRQIALKLNKTPTAIDKWASQGTIRHENAEKLSQLSGYRTDWIYYGHEPMLISEQNARDEVIRYNISATEQKIVDLLQELDQEQTLTVLSVAEQLSKKNSS